MDDIFTLAQQAINEALSSNWEKAILKNKEILDRNPNNIEARNRLARAYLEIGEIEAAKKIYQEVLEIDPCNQIALKNLQRISKLNGNVSNNKHNGHSKINFNIFLAEPGKTKLVDLINLTSPQYLSTLSPGDLLKLQPKKHTVCLLDENNQYVGALPDDIAHLLISLINGGNVYEAYVKKASANCLQVILWEKYRSERFISQPSFLELRKIHYYQQIKEEVHNNERWFELSEEYEEKLTDEEPDEENYL